MLDPHVQQIKQEDDPTEDKGHLLELQRLEGRERQGKAKVLNSLVDDAHTGSSVVEFRRQLPRALPALGTRTLDHPLDVTASWSRETVVLAHRDAYLRAAFQPLLDFRVTVGKAKATGAVVIARG